MPYTPAISGLSGMSGLNATVLDYLISAAINNGGFEVAGAPFGSWGETTSGSSTVTQETANPHTGLVACSLNIDASSSIAAVTNTGRELLAGVTYQYSLWARCPQGVKNLLVKNNNISDGSGNLHALTTEWAKYEGSLTPASTGLFQIKRPSGQPSVSLVIDDVAVWVA